MHENIQAHAMFLQIGDDCLKLGLVAHFKGKQLPYIQPIGDRFDIRQCLVVQVGGDDGVAIGVEFSGNTGTDAIGVGNADNQCIFLRISLFLPFNHP